MWVEGAIFVKYYPKIPSRFCFFSFDTKKLNRKHREDLLHGRSFPIRRNSVLYGFSVSLFVLIHEWTEAKHDCEPFSAAAESPDAQKTYSWLSSAKRWRGIACPEIMLLSGVVWRMKSRGPKTDPRGTPKVRSVSEDKQSSSLILWHLPVKNNSNQLSAFPLTPSQSSSLFKRIVWSLVSKAAERSSNVGAVTLPASIDARISLWIWRGAFSGEWNFLYADWYWLDVFELFMCEFSWFTTTFSRTLGGKLILDTGR